MKLYIIAGEASGDLHAANLIKALRQREPGLEIRAWGGDLMEAAGATLVKHYRDLAFMGFAEVLMHLPTILRNLEFCKQDILAFKPDAVLFVDYPGFNLRMAEFVKKQGIPTSYYISPQLWAWKAGRVKQIRAYIDQMLCILPFETGWYAKHGVEAHYVGHPLLDALAAYPFDPAFRNHFGLDDRPVLALLPGSRRQEIAVKLPIMLEAVRNKLPAFQVVIAAAPSQDMAVYQKIVGDYPAQIIAGHTYDLLRCASAAIVTSGTATLETALIGTPEMVVYKGNPISYFIGKRLIKVKYISLVNLILDYPLLTELIQHDCNPPKIAATLEHLLQESETKKLQAAYVELRTLLGGAGASEKAAAYLQTFMKRGLPDSK